MARALRCFATAMGAVSFPLPTKLVALRPVAAVVQEVQQKMRQEVEQHDTSEAAAAAALATESGLVLDARHLPEGATHPALCT